MERTRCLIRMVLLSGTALLTFCSCSQYDRDRQIKADITVKAKNDVNFAGLRFTVEKGMVTLMGDCPTEKSRALVKQTLEAIHVIDSIDDHIRIIPVQLGDSFALKQSVDSVLANYPMVTAMQTDTALIVTGSVKRGEADKIKAAIGKLSPGTTLYQLTQL